MRKIYSTIYLCLFFIGLQAQAPINKKEFHRELKQKIMYEAEQPEQLYRPKSYKVPASPQKSWDHGDAPEWGWSQEFGGSGTDYAKDIVTDDNGNFYISGYFSGEISFGDNTFNSTGIQDAFVAKFNSSDQLEWFRQIQSGANEKAALNAIHLDDDGQIYATGYFSNTLSAGAFNLSGNNTQNFFYIKLNNLGEVELAITDDNGTLDEAGKAILTDANLNVYALTDSSILKWDATGNPIWTIKESHIFNDFEIINNKLYYTGQLSVGLGEFGGIIYTTEGPGKEFFFASSDLDGNFTFLELPSHIEYTSYQPSQAEAGFEISTDAHKNIYLSGVFYKNLIIAEDTLSTTSNYNSYNFIAKYDTTGNAQWATKVDEELSSQWNLPITSSEDSTIYIAYPNVYKSFDHNGDLIAVNDTLAFTPQALTINKNNGALATAGTKNGGIYFSTQNNNLEHTENIEFTNNAASAYVSRTAADQQGNVYLYGRCDNSIEYHNTSIPKGVFLAKHNSEGNLIWIKSIPDASNNTMIGNQLVIDPQEQHLFITGNFTDTINIPGGETLVTQAEESNFFIKFDINGEFIWATQIDGLENDYSDLAVDYSGNLIFTKAISISGTITIGDETYESMGGDDVILVKFNSNSDIQWSRLFGGEITEYSGISSVDEEGNIYFTGEFISQNVQFGDSTITLNEGDGNIPLVKINPDGEIKWIKILGGSASETNSWLDGYCWPTDIQTLPDGHTYIKGWHGDSAVFSDTILTSGHGYYSYFIGKFDPDGNAVWVRSINEKTWGFDYNQMDVDCDGNVYFGAQAVDTIYFQYYQEEYPYAATGAGDIFITKYTTNGEIDWIKTIGSRDIKISLSSIAVSDNNKLYAAGYYNDYMSIGDDEYYTPANHGFIASIGDFNYIQSPTAISISNDSVGLNDPIGTEIGVFSTEDPDIDDQHTYSFITGDGTNDADNNKFEIIGDTLVTGVEFNDETHDKFYIYVQTEDLDGNTFAQEFVIYLDSDTETSINNSKHSSFKLYPNPITNNLFISNLDANQINEYNIRIVSIDGQSVYNQNHQFSETLKIDLNGLPNGIYIVNIQSTNQNNQFKIIKK